MLFLPAAACCRSVPIGDNAPAAGRIAAGVDQGRMMEKLIAELKRLYLPAGGADPAALTRQFAGEQGGAISLVTADGLTRAVVLAFDKLPRGAEDQHWSKLCEVAHALQEQLDFPAPAVSISGAHGYRLWLSLATPVALAQARQLAQALQQAYCADWPLTDAMPQLPPFLHAGSGKWAAFIHPGMGAAFAEEPGLDMAPPLAAQAGFLEGLTSIDAQQLAQALARLAQDHGAAPVPLPAPHGLLLKDATLDDIVRFLHAKKIEPTFRHLI